METESLEDGLLAAKSSVKLRDVTPSDSKATPTVVLSSMVALCGSLTIGCSVSTTNFHGLTIKKKNHLNFKCIALAYDHFLSVNGIKIEGSIWTILKP